MNSYGSNRDLTAERKNPGVGVPVMSKWILCGHTAASGAKRDLGAGRQNLLCSNCVAAKAAEKAAKKKAEAC